MMALPKRINYICFLIKCFLELAEVELFTLLSSASPLFLWGYYSSHHKCYAQ